LLGAAAALYIALTLHAARVETPTVDEFAHLPAGCVYWKTGDFELYAKNPPLVKLWMSLPLVTDPRLAVPPVTSTEGMWAPWTYGKAFMNANRANYFALFFRARIMIILLGLLTGGLLFAWARELFSLPTASILASLFLLSPTVLAHGHLATIDMGCAFTTMLAVLAIRRSCRVPGWRWAALGGAALGLALTVKFTAVLLLPVIAILLPLSRLRSGNRPDPRRLSSMFRDLGVLVLAAVLVINALMGFAGAFRPVGAFVFQSAFARGVQQHLPGWLPVPLPAAYATGFDAQKLDTESGEAGSYMLGRWSRQGWWYYNFFALLVKEPEPLLLLLVLAPWFWRKRPRGKGSGGTGPGGKDATMFLVVPALVLLVFLSFFNRLNIGIRYLLPVLPFLYLLVGPVIEAIHRHPRRWLRWGGATLLLGYYAATAVAVSPAWLSYFNPVSGGPAGGGRLLLDSNIDWGQDLYRLPALRPKLGEDEPLGLLYFGHVDPALYGIKYTPIPPQPVRGLLAVSVNFLHDYPYYIAMPDGQVALVEQGHLDWLRGLSPVARLGSIWVFDTRKGP
jgi:4-amino-4-deoxy-L-arabinose transferase-like glycosyltransferase